MINSLEDQYGFKSALSPRERDYLDPSVVHEWHYALNWLTGAGGIAQWDDVRPDT